VILNPKRSLIIAAAFFIASPLCAQMGGGMRQPDIRVMVWNPAVGQGSEYEYVKSGGDKTNFSLVVISKEDVDGKPGYWLETAINSPQMGLVYAQMLMSPQSAQMHMAKMIIQMPNMPPMIMPTGMGGRGGNMGIKDTDSDFTKTASRVGTETITVPAGTFECEHWRATDGSGDGWISSKVVPFSLVKMTGKDGESMTLLKQVSDAKSHLNGTPVPFDPTLFMGRGRRGN